jgi:hypothetical protein
MAFAGMLSVPANSQENEKIEGNGKMVTKNISVKSFNNLKASGVFELHLVQGETESVKVEADENLHALFIIKNEGNDLVIEMDKKKNLNLKSKNRLKVYVNFKNLQSINLSTVGNVKSDKLMRFNDLTLQCNSVGNIDLRLNANTLKINNNSVGNVSLSGEAKTAVIKSSGVGSLEANGLIVQDMDIENSGVGSAEVNVVRELKVKDSFLGKVKNNGKAPMKKMNNVTS